MGRVGKKGYRKEVILVGGIEEWQEDYGIAGKRTYIWHRYGTVKMSSLGTPE